MLEGELREEKRERERGGGDGGLGERVSLGPPMAVPLSSDGIRNCHKFNAYLPLLEPILV